MIKRYSEKGNVRKGKFTPAEAEAVFNNLPPYMADVAEFAYETGHRSGEIRKLLLVSLGNRMLSAFQGQSRRMARKNRSH